MEPTHIGQDGTAAFGRFTDVDVSPERQALVAFLDWAENQRWVRDVRRRLAEVLRLRAGSRVVDVGCGTGAVVAGMVAEGVAATGVDSSEVMIALARQRHPGCTFEVGGAERLPIESASLAGYRAERVLQHVGDPVVVVSEARRVLAPGGRIAVQDTDYDGWAVASDDVRTTRALIRALGDSVAHRSAGLSYRSWFTDAGFTEVSVEGIMYVETSLDACEPLLNILVNTGMNAGVVSADQGFSWLAEQRRRSETGRFCMYSPLFLASAERR
jgi:SAM-dependent methyltransferase